MPHASSGKRGSLAAALHGRSPTFAAREGYRAGTGEFAPTPRPGDPGECDAKEAMSGDLPGHIAPEPAHDPGLRAIELARADAFAAGLAAGKACAETEIGATLAQCTALASAIAAARAINTAELADVLADAVRSLMAELLDAEPDLTACGIEARARRALELVALAHEPATLWLSPADAALLNADFAQGTVVVIPDPTLARGALRVTTRYSRLDDNPQARLDRLAPSLRDAAHAASARPDVAQAA